MKNEDLFFAMNGIDDKIVVETFNLSKGGNKIVHFQKRLSFAACLCIILLATATVTAVAAIHHFWGRAMSGSLQSTDEQQQTMTEQGQAIVYPELTDYSSYQVNDQGVTIAPETVVVDEKFCYISFKVSGFDAGENTEPAAEVNYYLGDNPDEESSWINGSSSFYDGIIVGEDGSPIYEDGSKIEIGVNGDIVSHYYDENECLEYVIQMQTVDENTSMLGSVLHVKFSDLGIYSGKAEYESLISGNWDFTLTLPSTSNTQNLVVKKEVPNSNFTIESIDISPVSISVNFKANGETKPVENDELEIPEFAGFVLKDGTRLPYVANGGSDGYTDESHIYAICTRGFDRIIDISQVKALLLWPDDSGERELVEVDIQ